MNTYLSLNARNWGHFRNVHLNTGRVRLKIYGTSTQQHLKKADPYFVLNLHLKTFSKGRVTLKIYMTQHQPNSTLKKPTPYFISLHLHLHSSNLLGKQDELIVQKTSRVTSQ